MAKNQFKLLSWIIAFNLLSSAMHYIDNIIYLEHYPDPAWMQAYMIALFWFFMTAFVFVGLYFLRKNLVKYAVICFYVYSALSLLVLAHYFIQAINTIAFKINFLIFLEAFAALSLIVVASMILLTTKKNYQ